MKEGIKLVVFCLALLSGCLYFIFSFEDPEQSKRQTGNPEETIIGTEPVEIVRNITPERMLPGPVFEEGSLERLPDVVPPPPPPKPPKPIVWNRPFVVSAGVLISQKKQIVLNDIIPVELDRNCTYEDGTSWPCGRLARTEMRQFVRGRTIDCDPIEDTEALRVNTKCRLGNYDMSAWLVLTGWAEPEEGHYEEELEEAKRKERGIWRKNAP